MSPVAGFGIVVFTRIAQASSAVSEQAGEAIRHLLRDTDIHNQSVQGVYEMNQFAISHYQPAFACGSFQSGVLLPAPRELSEEEIESVSGGIAPLIIAGARIAGVAFATTFGATLGAKTAELVWSGISSVWGEEEQACR